MINKKKAKKKIHDQHNLKLIMDYKVNFLELMQNKII